MAVPSSLTLNYDALLSTTMFNVRSELTDAISTSNVFFHFIMKNREAYVSNDSIGERSQIPLMYALAPADSYSGYDVLDTTPTDGLTSAFYDWRQFATHVSISGEEEKKNKGENAILKLLQAKTNQAVMGIQEKFAKALLQGNGLNGGNLYDAYVSPSNDSVFIDPLLKLIDADNDRNAAVGNINPLTYSWWRNVARDADAAAPVAVTTFATLLKAMRKFHNDCAKGPGGAPDVYLSDQATFELYEAALTSFHYNVGWGKADIPFDNIQFRGKPVTWDEFMPDAGGNTTTITDNGTLIALNTKFWEIEYEADTNFEPQGFRKPDNQDAKVNQILWMGAAKTSNRRKQGVMYNIPHGVAS